MKCIALYLDLFSEGIYIVDNFLFIMHVWVLPETIRRTNAVSKSNNCSGVEIKHIEEVLYQLILDFS